MYPTILDTKTGVKVKATGWDYSFFWWAEGNGSCDCNRVILFGRKAEKELEAIHGVGICFGNHRYIATDIHGDLEGLTKEEILMALNDGYPEEVLNEQSD